MNQTYTINKQDGHAMIRLGSILADLTHGTVYFYCTRTNQTSEQILGEVIQVKKLINENVQQDNRSRMYDETEKFVLLFVFEGKDVKILSDYLDSVADPDMPLSSRCMLQQRVTKIVLAHSDIQVTKIIGTDYPNLNEKINEKRSVLCTEGDGIVVRADFFKKSSIFRFGIGIGAIQNKTSRTSDDVVLSYCLKILNKDMSDDFFMRMQTKHSICISPDLVYGGREEISDASGFHALISVVVPCRFPVHMVSRDGQSSIKRLHKLLGEESKDEPQDAIQKIVNSVYQTSSIYLSNIVLKKFTDNIVCMTDNDKKSLLLDLLED